MRREAAARAEFMPDADKRGGYPLGGTLLGVFLLVYVFFPFVFVLPLVGIYGPGGPVPPAVRYFFWPVIYLDEHVRSYHALIEAESKWVGIR